MNVRILNSDPVLLRNLKPDRIVNVKIIDRDADTANIEINGLKAKAAIGTDVGDSFFALVEQGKEENGNLIVRLRVLGSLISSGYLKNKKESSLLENFRIILTEKNLPVEESYLNAAGIIYNKGLKFERDNLRTVHAALLKEGPEFAGLIALFIEAGLVIDEKFAELLLNFKTILKMLNRKKPLLNRTSEDKNKNPAGTAGILQEIFRIFFGNDGKYFIGTEDYRHNDIPVQWRKEENNGFTRFYFDFGSGQTGPFILVSDYSESFISIRVYLDDKFLLQNKAALEKYSQNAVVLFGSIARGRRITLAVLPLLHRFMFWEGENRESIVKHKEELFNIDISV